MRLFGLQLWKLSLLLLVSVAVQVASSVNAASSSPKAVVPFTSFNFGDVYTGDIISQIFVIKNEGDAELLITDFKGDCGCTVARSDRVIPPGKEGTAELEVQTVSQAGSISKFATLHTNDPARPTIVFTIVANVLKGAPVRRGKYIGPIFVSPDSVLAMFAFPGKRARAEISVTAGAAPVNIIRVEAGTKKFIPVVEAVEPGKSYKIRVESVEIETGGLYVDKLRVVTDNPALPAFTVDVSLRVYSQ